jgi:predicted metal-binding membrane protein
MTESARLGSAAASTPAPRRSVQRVTVWVVGVAVLGWASLAWLAVDMAHPLARLTMPESSGWSLSNALAIGLMWAVMMAAMMLPSALPMIRIHGELCSRSNHAAAHAIFVGAYLMVWLLFSLAATAAQWALQAAGRIDPMVVSTSALLDGLLLVIAGVYQFSPLTRICLGRCRSPMAFLLGEWRAGLLGSFRMGLRHGAHCLGCCWALMGLLFVGGVMNLPWVAALSIAVALEKLAPRGDRLATLMGVTLIAAGATRMLVPLW